MLIIKEDNTYKDTLCVEVREVLEEKSKFSIVVPSSISILKHSDGTCSGTYNKRGWFWSRSFENEKDMIDDLRSNDSLCDLLDDDDISKMMKILNINI